MQHRPKLHHIVSSSLKETKIKIVQIPDFSLGSMVYKLDSGKLKLGSSVVNELRRRDEYNLRTKIFNVGKHNGVYCLLFDSHPFFYALSNREFSKDQINPESIDKLVYMASGSVKEGRPNFKSSNPDTVFIYSCTDAQIMRYSREWHNSGFLDNSVRAIIDGQNRIKRNPMYQLIERLVDDNGYILMTGHPKLFCVTLTRPPKEHNNNLPAQSYQHSQGS